MIDIKGKVAIITGYTKGIGRGIANAMAEYGANLVIVSRHQNECDSVANEISNKYGISAIGISADITKKADIDELVNKTNNRFGCIDILVNNAGSAITKRAEDLTEEYWYKVINLDLNSLFFCSQAVGRHMITQKSGKIINIASMLGLIADKQVLPYVTAKGGIIQMTKGLALEWAKHNIQVNAICPGYVITDMNKAELTNDKISSGLLKKNCYA